MIFSIVSSFILDVNKYAFSVFYLITLAKHLLNVGLYNKSVRFY